MITRPSSLLPSITDRYDRQIVTAMDQKTSKDSTD
jgi:hypothetical protein